MATTAVEYDDVPLLLGEMRLAWQRSSPDTPGEWQAVEWLRTDPKGFRAQMVKLESELSQGKVVRTEAAGVVVDVGTENLELEIEAILSQAGG